MQKSHYLVLALVSLGISLFGCGSDPETTATGGGSPITAATGGTNGLPSAGGPVANGSGGSSYTSTTGKNAGAGGKGAAGKVNTKAGSGGSSAKGGKAGAAGKNGTAGTTPTNDAGKPAPVDTPYVWGVGVGITDLPAAIAFYKEVMKLTVEKEVTREDRKEVVLYASEANRGSRLVLMKFNDNRNTEKITAKLVWTAPNPTGVSSEASSYPDYVSRGNFGFGVQFDGPSTYVHEVVSGMDPGAPAGITVPYLIALGFSTSDLAASRQFYIDALGMSESPTGSFPVVDANGSGYITEYTETLSAGAGLVLQTWSPVRNSKDNPVKVVIFVPDAQAVADKLVAAGGSIAEKAARTAVYDNRLLIVAKDPDGYILELVQ